MQQANDKWNHVKLSHTTAFKNDTWRNYQLCCITYNQHRLQEFFLLQF